MFSHIVVDAKFDAVQYGKVTYCGNAYIIGSKEECEQWIAAQENPALYAVEEF